MILKLFGPIVQVKEMPETVRAYTPQAREGSLCSMKDGCVVVNVCCCWCTVPCRDLPAPLTGEGKSRHHPAGQSRCKFAAGAHGT